MLFSNFIPGYIPITFEVKAEPHICTSMSIAALVTITKRWKQPYFHKQMNGETKYAMYI